MKINIFYVSLALLATLFTGFQGRAAGLRITYPNQDVIMSSGDSLKVTWQTTDTTIKHVTVFLVDLQGKKYELARNISNENKLYTTYSLSEANKVFRLMIADATTEENQAISSSKLTVIHEWQVPTIRQQKNYAGLQKTMNRTIFKTNGRMLYFRLFQNHQRQALMSASLLDKAAGALAIVGIKANAGHNFYEIDLRDVTITQQGFWLKEDAIYFLEVKDRSGQIQRLKFQYTEVPSLGNAIIPKVEYIQCEVPNATKITYLPAIYEGTAPYTVHWYVSATPNKSEASFMQTHTISAKQLSANHPDGNVNANQAKLTVTQDLSYYVILEVVDNCGKIAEKTAYITCKPAKKAKNQLSIQWLSPNPSAGKLD